MKNLYILFSFFILIIFNKSLLSIEKVSDPIKNSYIITNLHMENDLNIFNTDEKINEGEIIFDNSFNAGLPDKNPEKKINNSAKILKELQKKDKKTHLVEYRIKRNDNLSVIAKRFNTTVSILAELNNIQNRRLLKENHVLLIPSNKGIIYKINKGDTLTAISGKYNVEIDVIAKHNNIDTSRIIAGKKIFLPGAEEPLVARKEQMEKKTDDTKYRAGLTPGDNKNKDDKNADEKDAGSDRKLALIWPLRGPITSGFGVRTHPFSGEKKFHCGLDIGAEPGTVVRASGDGTVIFSGWKELYGNIIVISHKNDYITIYAHNSKNLVGADEPVKKGQKIALSGKTGAVTGAHLHFEIRKGIVPLDPLRILK